MYILETDKNYNSVKFMCPITKLILHPENFLSSKDIIFVVLFIYLFLDILEFIRKLGNKLLSLTQINTDRYHHSFNL